MIIHTETDSTKRNLFERAYNTHKLINRLLRSIDKNERKVVEISLI